MITQKMQADKEHAARSLYDTARLCPHRKSISEFCQQAVTFADELQGQCPSCGGALVAGPGVDGLAMLAELRELRVKLGLGVE